MGKFRPGDKVRYVRDRSGGGTDYADYLNLKKGEVFTVEKLQSYDKTLICLLPASRYTRWLHEEQFDLARMSNEERIAKRMEELHA